MESKAAKEGEPGGGKLGRLGLLAALLAVFLVMKGATDPAPAGHFRADATTYYLVARSVAEGEGLRTPVSLYHQGLCDLPARSPIYPLWPLVLGAAGSLVGLERAARLLPEALYFVDLLLVYLLGNALAGELRRRAGVAHRPPWLDLGHLAVLLLGSNRKFFQDTSMCLTEALAFGLLFAALLLVRNGEAEQECRGRRPRHSSQARGIDAGARPRAPRGLLLGLGASRSLHAAGAGALAGLAYLTRSQFLLVPVAIPLAFLLVGPRRPESRRAAAIAAAGALLAILPWVVFLLALPGDFAPRMLVDFTAYRETPSLPVFTGFVEPSSLWGRLVDFASGLAVAFGPLEPQSYFNLFGAVMAAVPLALGIRLWSALHPRRAAASAPSSPKLSSPLFHATVLTTLASLLPLHAMHGIYPVEWFFGGRHGYPMFLGILLATGVLLVQRRPVPLLALALCAGSVVARNPLEDLRREQARKGNRADIWPEERVLTGWLDEHERPALAISTRCRELALWSSARFHWIRCDSSPEETRSLCRNLPIDYLIVYSDELDCAFHQGLESEVELVRECRSGARWISVYRWRR